MKQNAVKLRAAGHRTLFPKLHAGSHLFWKLDYSGATWAEGRYWLPDAAQKMSSSEVVTGGNQHNPGLSTVIRFLFIWSTLMICPHVPQMSHCNICVYLYSSVRAEICTDLCTHIMTNDFILICFCAKWHLFDFTRFIRTHYHTHTRARAGAHTEPIDRSVHVGT